MRRADEADLRLFFPSEVIATNNLLNFFRSLSKQEPQIINNAADFDRVKDKNILILGGTKYNAPAKQFLQEIRGELFYIPKRLLDNVANLTEHELKVFAGRDAGYPDLTYDFQKEIQPATIILRKGLYAENRAVLLIAGIGQESTLAGVVWLLSRPFSFWIRAGRQCKGFQAMLTCRVLSQYKVSNIQTAFYQELS